MKLPIDADTYIEALHYAGITAGEHTHYHTGWAREELKQFGRILAGQIAQRYLVRLLRVNSVSVQEDATDYTESDQYDFKVKGFRFDVKSSVHSLMPMQITTTTKRKKPDYFVFCRLALDLKSISILGIVRAQEAIQEKFFVSEGEIIPHTDLIQLFKEGSYFYTGAYKPIEQFIAWASEKYIKNDGRHSEHPAY